MVAMVRARCTAGRRSIAVRAQRLRLAVLAGLCCPVRVELYVPPFGLNLHSPFGLNLHSPFGLNLHSPFGLSLSKPAPFL